VRFPPHSDQSITIRTLEDVARGIVECDLTCTGHIPPQLAPFPSVRIGTATEGEAVGKGDVLRKDQSVFRRVVSDHGMMGTVLWEQQPDLSQDR